LFSFYLTYGYWFENDSIKRSSFWFFIEINDFN
jgi:hypothetical protein